MLKLAKIDTVKADSQNMKELIKRVQSTISESLATKNDVTKMETKLVRYSNTTFVTLEG